MQTAINILELFDTKVDIKTDYQILSSVSYLFTIGDIEYNFKANNEKGSWEVMFGQEKGIGITGTGNAIQVFAAVGQCIDMFLKKKKPMEFWFTAKEPSRKKLYDKMAKVIIRKYKNYSFEKHKSYDSDGVYVFTDK